MNKTAADNLLCVYCRKVINHVTCFHCKSGECSKSSFIWFAWYCYSKNSLLNVDHFILYTDFDFGLSATWYLPVVIVEAHCDGLGNDDGFITLLPKDNPARI